MYWVYQFFREKFINNTLEHIVFDSTSVWQWVIYQRPRKRSEPAFYLYMVVATRYYCRCYKVLRRRTHVDACKNRLFNRPKACESHHIKSHYFISFNQLLWEITPLVLKQKPTDIVRHKYQNGMYQTLLLYKVPIMCLNWYFVQKICKHKHT